MAFKQWCDCVNYESSNYDNTWADQQAVIALRQHPTIVFCLLIVLCADSWHLSGVLIMRTVSRQLQKTTRYKCAALTSVIDFIRFILCVTHHTQIFPYNSPPSLISLLNFQHPIHTTLTFSFQLLKLFFPWTILQKLSLSTPAHSFFISCFLSFHFFHFTVILHSFLLFLSSFTLNYMNHQPKVSAKKWDKTQLI